LYSSAAPIWLGIKHTALPAAAKIQPADSAVTTTAVPTPTALASVARPAKRMLARAPSDAF
jgi:hypothetical protein